MSQESVEIVEIVRAFFEAWNAGEMDALDVDIYRGHKSLGAFVDAWTGMFPDIRVELAGDSIDLGDQVITPTLIVGTAVSAGIKVHDPYSFLIKIAQGKIVFGQEFHDNAEALAAVGLAE